MLWRHLLAVLCAAVALGSCSGGGGGGDSASAGASTGKPLVWDSAGATWNNVDWQ